MCYLKDNFLHTAATAGLPVTLTFSGSNGAAEKEDKTSNRRKISSYEPANGMD